MLAIVAPGQGAQKSGFLSPWLELESAAARLASYSEAAGVDLTRHGTESDDDTIRDTAIAQPLLVAAGLLAWYELQTPLHASTIVGGHSVGELTAAAIAGVISDQAAMSVVATRGRAMAEAAALQPTSMTAVLGGERDVVLASIAAAGLTAANDNGPGQIVAAGTMDQLAAFAAAPPERARLRPLSVAGAFHTVHMEPAISQLEAVTATVEVQDPQARLISNADGLVVTSGSEAIGRIVRQVANPVRWDLCLSALAEHGVTGLLELNPAGTLTGIAKRNLKEVELCNLNTPDQLDDARSFVARHTSP